MGDLQDLTKKITMPEPGSFEIERSMGICDVHNIEVEFIKIQGLSRKGKNCPLCIKETEGKEKEYQAEIERQRIQNQINKRLENSMLGQRFKDKTFANYNASTSKQIAAIEAAKWFIENIRQSPGLIMVGKTGTGKNHLASAIIHEAVKSYTCLFTEAIKLIRAIKESWRSEGPTESAILKQFTVPDLLVIDEIGVLYGSETEKLYLTEVINDRYSHCKPTILIANLTMEELRGTIGDRAIERFKEGGKIIVFDWESYRAKADLVTNNLLGTTR